MNEIKYTAYLVMFGDNLAFCMWLDNSRHYIYKLFSKSYICNIDAPEALI